MLCKHTKFYLHKKGDPTGTAFNETLDAKLHITLHRLASTNQVTITISGVDTRNRRPKLVRLHIGQREYRFLT